MEKFDSIIFDLDGTLCSTINTCVKTLADFKKQHTDILYEISAEDVKKSMGKPFEEIALNYYGYLGKEKAEKYAKEAFTNNVQNLLKNGGTLYPGVEETIKELSQEFKLCIVSNCIEGYIEACLKNSGLEQYFCDFENHGRTGLSKGENIKLVMERNGLKNAMYVGDTISDKTAADFAGILFAYASYGFGDVSEYDYKLNNIEDLVTILN